MNSKKIISIILILIILVGNLINFWFKNESNADSETVELTYSTDIDSIDESKYPGIKEKIQQLQSEYPNWTFKVLYTGLDWNEFISSEYSGHGSSPRNLIYKSSTYSDEWICSICGDTSYDNGNWRCASEKAIEYMIDPRNILNIANIFQFEDLSYTECSVSDLKSMTNGTFLYGHEQEIINAAKNNNVNAYYIIARLIQEQGTSGTVLTSGEGYDGEYVGYYNAFNIAASGNSTSEILKNALAYAEKMGWTSLEKSIEGGIQSVAKYYIKQGQNTIYFQKFNSATGDVTHQYMQNLTASLTEGTTLRNTYLNTNMFASKHTFIIPLYENMPSEISYRPNSSEADSTDIDIVKVNVDSDGLTLRSSPAGTQIGRLTTDEIVVRLEKATTTVNGIYWDKVMKSSGTIGYVARETKEGASTYKQYLVPIDTKIIASSKAKIDEENKMIITSPNAIASDILELFGGTAKITKEDGNYLNGEQDSMKTGYIVEDEYIVVKKGDCNSDGIVNTFDYIRIMNSILGNKTLTDSQKIAADANNDGQVNSFDYIRIMNYIMGNKEITIY